MAVGLLGAMGTVHGLDGHMFVGELSLNGTVRPVRGTLSVAVCARDRGILNLIVPAENAAEGAVVEGVRVFGVKGASGTFVRRRSAINEPFPRRTDTALDMMRVIKGRAATAASAALLVLPVLLAPL